MTSRRGTTWSVLLALCLNSLASAVAQSSDDATFSSGTVPADAGGQPVFAHEGCMLTNEDAYLWYGSSQKQNVSDGTRWDWLSDSVILYTSHDLAGWKRRATVFTAGDVPAAVRQQLLAGSNEPLRMERPKVLYNAARRYYVLMVSLGSLDRSKAAVGWAVSVSPYGPFKFDGAGQPDGLPSWDITVASDSDDTDAWLARTVPNTGIVISKLNADFLDSSGRCATIPAPKPAWQLRLQPVTRAVSLLQQLRRGGGTDNRNVESATAGPPRTALAAAAAAAAGGSLRSGLHAAGRALRFWLVDGGHPMRPSAAGAATTAAAAKARDAGAPCLFKFRGKWYLLAAQQAGWAPTKAVLYVNDGSPCDESSWRQLPPPASGPGASHTFESTPAFVYAHQFVGSDQVLLVYFGDRWSPSDPRGPASASYVWLPLVPSQGAGQPDSLQLLNLSTWRLGDFRPAAHAEDS